MSYSKIYFLFFFWNILFLRGKQPVLGFNHRCPEFCWVAQYWWRMKVEKWKQLKVLKIRFAVYWVFKNSHGGKSTDLCIQGSESWSWVTRHHGRGQAAHPSISQWGRTSQMHEIQSFSWTIQLFTASFLDFSKYNSTRWGRRVSWFQVSNLKAEQPLHNYWTDIISKKSLQDKTFPLFKE